jgi:hypothetical protein
MVVEATEVTIVVVLKDSLAGLPRVVGLKGDACSILALQLFEGSFRVGIGCGSSIRCRTGTSSTRSEALNLAYGHASLSDAAGEAKAGLGVVDGEERAGVARGEAALFEQFLDGIFEF